MTLVSTPIGDVHAPAKAEPCDPFYFDDSQVEQQLFKVHRYFLVRESEFFQGDPARVEGVDDEHPICILDTTIAELKSLLRFFYFGMHDDYKARAPDWIATLTISTRLIFPKVRERAINELTYCLEEIDPFDLVGLAVKYDVEKWLKPAYRRIMTRINLITHAEAEKVPFLVAVMLMRSRERYWKTSYAHTTSLISDIVDSEVRLMGPVYITPKERMLGENSTLMTYQLLQFLWLLKRWIFTISTLFVAFSQGTLTLSTK
ncbi:hypothetical protein EDB86DRAFT_2827996 [Lactarius hatsudake]|nr:hypothetical protein EDB86DRAFT_2827996 [Lactarius hatsudake]